MTVHLNADRGRVLDPAFVLNLPDVALVSADDELVRNLPAPSLRRILSRVDKIRRQHSSRPYGNKKKLGNRNKRTCGLQSMARNAGGGSLGYGDVMRNECGPCVCVLSTSFVSSTARFLSTGGFPGPSVLGL